MNIKKIIFYTFIAVFPINYSLFCPKDEFRIIELSNDTTWSTPEIFKNQDGAIKGLYIPKIQLILRGQNIIVVTGPHKLLLTDLTILPDNPDVFCIEDENSELILENCTFILDGKNLQLCVKKIAIFGNIEFIGLNPGIIKRIIGSLVSWTITEQFAERFVLDYPLVIFSKLARFTKGDKSAKLLFDKTIHEIDWILESKPTKPTRSVHFKE